MKKASQRIVALLLVACTLLSLTACRKKPGTGDPETQAPGASEPSAGGAVTYTVTVTNKAGKPVEEVGVFIYEDETKEELVWFARTDAEGKVSFTYTADTPCVATLSELPEGYTCEEIYNIEGPDTTIVLGGNAVGDAEWQLGTEMPDFTFTDCEGNTYTLSELLKEKKAVVLNFWYIQCAPCKMEFPFLQEAYEEYKDRIEVLAVNPMNQDNEEIAAYKKENKLTFPMGAVPPEWEQAIGLRGYPTTVVIDRTGVISFIHTGGIEDTKSFVSIFEYFTSEDYVPGVVESLDEILAKTNIHLGTREDPLEFPGKLTFELEIPAGQETFVQLYKINSMILQAKSPDVYLIYKDKKFEANGNGLSTMISSPDLRTPVLLCFGNSSDKDITVKVTLSIPGGTLSNPYTMKLGQTSVKVYSGNDQGVTYRYTAPEDGEFKLTCLSINPGNVKYDMNLTNPSNMAVRNLESDGQKDEEGHDYLTIKLKKGQQVIVTVMTLPDASRNFPGATIVVDAAFTAGDVGDIGGEEEKIVDYAITVTDENRMPLAGVSFSVKDENRTIRFVTDASGVARIQLKAGTYEAVMTLPDGYKGGNTKFTLTEEIPMLSVKLDKDVQTIDTYTVKVQNEAGEPIGNVLVALGSGMAMTNAEGIVTFTLPTDKYTAEIMVPAGYDDSVRKFPFAKGETTLVITLKKLEAPTDPSAPADITYTVTVLDAAGNPVTNAAVKLMKDGSMIATAFVNDSGVAAIDAAPDTYTVELASTDGGELYYVPATVTAEATDVTIKLALPRGDETEELYVGTAYKVGLGQTYIKMQADATNFFVFYPEVSGEYYFTVHGEGAKIGYWGSNPSFIADQSDRVVKDNAFTLNIKEASVTALNVISLTGAEECVLEIVRLGDAILDENDIPYTEYEALTPPADVFVFKQPAGTTQTYFDLTAANVNLVFNEADGYYHLDSANGPTVYVNLGMDAPFIQFWLMLGYAGYGGTSMSRIFRDENGKITDKIDYTNALKKYVEAMDEETGLYPLTEDLKTIIYNGGEGKGWWDRTSPSFLFADYEAEYGPINPEIAWLFCSCIFK